MKFKITRVWPRFYGEEHLYELNNEFYVYSLNDAKTVDDFFNTNGRFKPDPANCIIIPFTVDEAKRHLKMYPKQEKLQLVVYYFQEKQSIVCECGAEKCNTTHSNWCPKA